jgi:cytosine permease
VIGGIIVNVMVQPDYARFVRRPGRAGLASGLALGVTFPLLLIVTALTVNRSGAPDLIAAMVMAGVGLPAMALVTLGAMIDGSACLYSGSLSLTNEIRSFRLPWVIVSGTIAGFVVAALHIDEYYLPFLSMLGVTFPPVVAITLLHNLWPTRHVPRIRASAGAGWIGGTLAGHLTTAGYASITGISAIDSMVVATALWALLRISSGRSR